MPEAPGSACYITKEGDVDIQVTLKVVTSQILSLLSLICFFFLNYTLV